MKCHQLNEIRVKLNEIRVKLNEIRVKLNEIRVKLNEIRVTWTGEATGTMAGFLLQRVGLASLDKMCSTSGRTRPVPIS